MCRRLGPALVLSVLLAVGLRAASARELDGKQVLARIAFGSCAHQDRPQPIWGPIVAGKPDLFLFLGDNIYADTQDMGVMKAKYDKLAAVPGYKKLLATCPVLATWDDHDYGADDAGAEYPKKKEAQQLFLDFFGVPKDSPRRRQEGVYHSVVVGPEGKRVQIILLDTRYFRSALKRDPKRPRNIGPYVPSTDEKATILGEAQWRWLTEQLARPAELRLVCSSIQVVADDHGWEKWANLPHERERLYRLIKETKAGGVVFLSGDRHLAELSVMDGGVGYPLYDLTSSGLNQANKRWRALEKNRHRVATMDRGDNYGLVTIDWNRPDPLVTLQIRDDEGDVTIGHKVPLGRLQPDARKVGKGGAGGVDLAAEARKHVGKEHTVEMVVAATGKNKSGSMVFLNSRADFRDEANFTVVLDMKAVGKALRDKGIADPRTHFTGKRVRVRGVVTLFEDAPQIRVKDLKQITVLEGRKD